MVSNNFLEIYNSNISNKLELLMKYFKTNFAGKCDMSVVSKLAKQQG